MRLRPLIAAALAICVMGAPATARPSDSVWDVTGCNETAVTVGDRADTAQQDVLLIIVYRCDEANINGLDVGAVAISEISVIHSDGTSRLLRQVTNSSILHDQLRSLGLRHSFLGTITYEQDQILVSFGRSRYSLAVTGSASPAPPTVTDGGASYTYEGHKGTIKIQYDNHEQNVAPSLVEVGASKDPSLSQWMGKPSVTAPAVIIQGAWTGTASLAGN